MAANPMTQFEVYRIGPEIKIGAFDISFTNASLFMVISSLAILVIFNFGSKWVDCVASHKDTKVCSSGKTVYIWTKNKDKPQTLEHQSTVAGLAFDNKGKRLAVSRYGGVTVWKLNNKKWTASNFTWKGSHGTVTFSPDTKYIVTAMQ